ncbi:MAG: CehA/McbA family metallohydrolase [Bacteroidota bacterium]
MKLWYIAILMLLSCTANKSGKEPDNFKWYKGNTHSHTTLSGHADTHPDTVALWYLDRGYNFLILSEHNTFIDPAGVHLPENRRKDFILIAGEEVSAYNEIHTTGMNTNRLVPAHYPKPLYDIEALDPFDNLKIFMMQEHVDSIRAAEGVPILNHPNWRSGASAAEIVQVERLHMLELYNGHPDVNNWGNEVHASMEVKWDSLLTAGRKIYGVSSDDAHFFQDWAEDISNPGRGWVMVKSKELTSDAITDAMVRGDFYASSGVILSSLFVSKELYEIDIDTAATLGEIDSPYIIGYKNGQSQNPWTIEFISDGGSILKEIIGTEGALEVPSDVTYVRAKITFSKPTETGSEQFFAWTQPLFLD